MAQRTNVLQLFVVACQLFGTTSFTSVYSLSWLNSTLELSLYFRESSAMSPLLLRLLLYYFDRDLHKQAKIPWHGVRVSAVRRRRAIGSFRPLPWASMAQDSLRIAFFFLNLPKFLIPDHPFFTFEIRSQKLRSRFTLHVGYSDRSRLEELSIGCVSYLCSIRIAMFVLSERNWVLELLG